MFRIIYYIASSIIGFMFAMVVGGSSISTTYLVDGKQVDHRITDTSFLIENFHKIRTKTVIDYDGLLSLFAGRHLDFLPSFTYQGDFGTPSTAYFMLIALNVVFVLLIAWGLRQVYIILRQRSAPS